MALVLRKAILPKNVSLLKCIKGRSLATTANKKNHVVLSTAVPRRRMRSENKARQLGSVQIEKTERLPVVRMCCEAKKNRLLPHCMSCPTLLPASRSSPWSRFGYPSPLRTRPAFMEALNPSHRHVASQSCLFGAIGLFHMKFGSELSLIRNYAKKSCPPCPCPPPCGPCGCPNGCGCLPPPCNQPPKCIQYMTGYYYYPYGFWFCGPYHVSGQCTPVGCPPPTCPPAKNCPPSCCICPAAAAVVGAASANSTGKEPPKGVVNPLQQQQQDAPKSDCTPNTPSESPKPARSGISKFLPFSAAATFPGPTTACHCPSTFRPLASLGKRDYSTASNSVYPYIEVTDIDCKSPHCEHNPCKANMSICTTLSRSSDTVLALERPKYLPTREERDKPHIKPGEFDYSKVPIFKYPYPPPPFSNFESS